MLARLSQEIGKAAPLITARCRCQPAGFGKGGGSVPGKPEGEGGKGRTWENGVGGNTLLGTGEMVPWWAEAARMPLSPPSAPAACMGTHMCTYVCVHTCEGAHTCACTCLAGSRISGGRCSWCSLAGTGAVLALPRAGQRRSAGVPRARRSDAEHGGGSEIPGCL